MWRLAFVVLIAVFLVGMSLPAQAKPGNGQGNDQGIGQGNSQGASGKSDQAPGQAKKAEPEGAVAPQESADAAPGKSDQAPGQQKKAESQSQGSSPGKGKSDHSEGNASTQGPHDEPQPASTADKNDGGANAGDCAEGPKHAYCSTRDGSASKNGNGNGKAKGKPCAGCVGKADNKNPKGQYPNGSDHNAGYECDRNNGIGKSNPAHTGCTTGNPSTPPVEPPAPNPEEPEKPEKPGKPEKPTPPVTPPVTPPGQPSTPPGPPPGPPGTPGNPCPEDMQREDGRCVPPVDVIEVEPPANEDADEDVVVAAPTGSGKPPTTEPEVLGVEAERQSPAVVAAPAEAQGLPSRGILPWTGAAGGVVTSALGGITLLAAGVLLLAARRRTV
ncbi:hypothetical protein GCM10027273_22450 [Nocardioides pakistanensis]